MAIKVEPFLKLLSLIGAGALTESTMSDSFKNAAVLATTAPASSYSLFVKPAFLPASASMVTLHPSETSFFTVSGDAAALVSLVLPSLRTANLVDITNYS